jgi:hypothetical protein
MVECDGLCAMDKPEAFAEAMGHILWEGHLSRGQMRRITTIGLRTECILSDGIWNPILQNLCGKSGLMSIIRYNCV